jgi:protein TonB
MTPKEILGADLLDIVFDNRNKSYGAYALRRFYENRLSAALITGLGTAIIVSMIIFFNEPPKIPVSLKELQKDVVTLVELPPDEIPEEPTPPRPAAAPANTIAITNIVIVPDNVDTDVPTAEDVDRYAISTVTNIDPDNNNNTLTVPQVQPTATVPASEPHTEPVELIQRQPEFPGGKNAWMNFLSKYLTVPEEMGYGEKRTVVVRFLVSEDGSITQFTVIQSGGKAFDNEVIRVLKKMPKWNPAIQNGRNVAVPFTQPVTFQSVEE